MGTGEAVAGAEKVRLVRITDGVRREVEDEVVVEASVTIVLDNLELVTLLCSPVDLKHLAVGYLFSEGLVKHRDEITRIEVDEGKGTVRVETREGKGVDPAVLGRRVVTTGAGKGASFYRLTEAHAGVKVGSGFRMRAGDVLDLVRLFQEGSKLHRVTRGVHSAALCDGRKIVMFADDVGRHNAIDRIVGRCVLDGLRVGDHALIFSGRISSEMLLKAARMRVPVIISVASPTSAAVRLAGEMGLTVVGMVSDKKMNVYCGDWRIITDEG